MQSVTKVLVGNKFVAAPVEGTLQTGDVVLLNQNGKYLAAANATDATAISVAVITGAQTIVVKNALGVYEETSIKTFDQTMPIQRRSNAKILYNAFAAPTQCEVVLELFGATITPGNRYVLRNYYRDMYEDKAGFTHNYEAVATSANAIDVADELVKKIKTHEGRRINVVLSTDVDRQSPGSGSFITITLTAREKDDNDDLKGLTEYSIVDFATSLYETRTRSHVLGDFWRPIQGVTLTKTSGKPGTGYWKQVRDLEKRNMAYNGIVYRGAFVPLEQDLNTTKNTEYNVLTVTYDNKYISADNQYTKDTPLQTSVYINRTDTTGASDLKAAIAAFVDGKEFPTV
jgi:hypothetical protein